MFYVFSHRELRWEINRTSNTLINPEQLMSSGRFIFSPAGRWRKKILDVSSSSLAGNFQSFGEEFWETRKEVASREERRGGANGCVGSHNK